LCTYSILKKAVLHFKKAVQLFLFAVAGNFFCCSSKLLFQVGYIVIFRQKKNSYSGNYRRNSSLSST
jgi:hypothetical protein